MAQGSYELFLVKPSRGRSVSQFRHIFTFTGVSVALNSRIQIFSCHFTAFFLALRFNRKNSKIGFRTRELWAFSGEACSWSVRSSIQTHPHFFRRFSGPEFQNPNFDQLLKSLVSWTSTQPQKPENRISHEGGMSFFWWSLVVVGPFLSLDTSLLFQTFCLAPSSRIQTLTYHWKACSLALRLNLKNSKIGYGMRELWAFSGEA
jgi:hypothetical protein